MTSEKKSALAQQWADIEASSVDRLLADTKLRGWVEALDTYAESDPFFVQRLRDTSLGNWHALLGQPRSGRSLDIGCGFGALLSGFSAYYQTAFGVEMLPERLRFAALRQGSREVLPSPLARASGHQLPFKSSCLDVITMNGVLEWAAYYVGGPARKQQLNMLREMRRVLAPEGTVAVAIENRYALENLVGMRDTHTGIRLIPAMPRPLAMLTSLALARRPYRTWLYSAGGYRHLLRDAGFPQARVLDLVSSYNDWDFVLNPEDTASYRLLWDLGWVKSFYPRTSTIRQRLAHHAPSLLGKINYAYLVLAGQTTTVLDPDHPVWHTLSTVDVPPGQHRFAIRLDAPGGVGVVTHDGKRIRHIILLTPAGVSDTITCTSELARHAISRFVQTTVVHKDGVELTVLAPPS